VRKIITKHGTGGGVLARIGIFLDAVAARLLIVEIADQFR